MLTRSPSSYASAPRIRGTLHASAAWTGRQQSFRQLARISARFFEHILRLGCNGAGYRYGVAHGVFSFSLINHIM